MTNEQAPEPMTESEAQRFAEKMQTWSLTLDPKEQDVLEAVLRCAHQVDAANGNHDVAGHATDGITQLIRVTQLKSSNANDAAVQGADHQRPLINQQTHLRGLFFALSDTVSVSHRTWP